MTKSNEPKTHFQQVPLKLVKTIAEQDIAKGKRDKSHGSSKAQAKKAAPSRSSRPGREQGRQSPV